MINAALKQELLNGELADLSLYKSLKEKSSGSLRSTLEVFVETETRHADYWRGLFGLTGTQPDFWGRARNAFVKMAVSLFGERAAFLLLEAVETHGIKKYLDVWEKAEDPETRQKIRVILIEEFQHEDEVATKGERLIDPGLIRNAFLGFNDGSVEILGAVTGLTAALGSSSLVAIAGLTVSMAGALSMAAGAFLSTDSELEITKTQVAKQRFLKGELAKDEINLVSPWKTAWIVGVAYIIGAAVPVLPFLLGASSPLWSILFSGVLILTVSAALAFLSGMNMKKRVALNTLVIVAAVVISYAIGFLADRLLS